MPPITPSFACYLEAMGGALAPPEHPIKLAHLIEEQANCYGEDIKRLMGLHTTRLGYQDPPARLGSGTSRHPEAAKAAGFRLVLGLRRATARHLGALTITVRSRILRRSRISLMAEQWAISLLYRAFAGRCQRDCGRLHLWLENGQVQSSRERSRANRIGSQKARCQTNRASRMSTRYRKAIRTGRRWLSCAARSTRRRATPGAPLDRDAAAALSVRDVRVLEGLDAPEWMQEQDDYSEEWA